MAELPKFVLRRLAGPAPAGDHLSADLLAAFAEQALSGAERERVVAHLAACGQCREVLWWAMPESEAPQTVIAGAAARRWSWASTWRWAGVAAAVAVIAGVALIFRGGPGPAGVRMVSAPPAPVIAERRDMPALDLKQRAKDSAPVAAPQTRLEAKAMPPKTAPVRRQEPAASEIAAANEIAADKELAKSTDMAGKREQAKATDEVAAAGASARAAVVPAAPAPLAAAKAAPAATARTGVMIASNMAPAPVGKKKLAPATRWMLSPEGALLRSTDAGKNWQAVPFQNTMVFRAVAAVGPQVWVGGQGGALYYSADDGSQWQRLSPSADGVTLTEDITALNFQDGQHGNLTTSSGQSWTTSDGGRTWQKQ